MKDQRKQIAAVRKAHTSLLLKASELERRFKKLHCRYRGEFTGYCEHTRATVAKWPGHMPTNTACRIDSCPRASIKD